MLHKHTVPATSIARWANRASNLYLVVSDFTQNGYLFGEFMSQPKITATKPADDPGYVMPAEWEPHAATWLAWPHHQADWPDKMETIRWVYGEMVRKISPGETVRLLVRHPARSKDSPPAISGARAAI